MGCSRRHDAPQRRRRVIRFRRASGKRFGPGLVVRGRGRLRLSEAGAGTIEPRPLPVTTVGPVATVAAAPVTTVAAAPVTTVAAVAPIAAVAADRRHQHGSPTMSHVIPQPILQVLNAHRWYFKEKSSTLKLTK